MQWTKMKILVAYRREILPSMYRKERGIRSFINICVDIFGIIWWACLRTLLWHYNGTLVQDMSFPATRLARPVSFPSTLLRICLQRFGLTSVAIHNILHHLRRHSRSGSKIFGTLAT